MATTEIVNLSDDLDPRIQNGVETVTFYDPSTGQKREIELGEANRKHFANHLEKLAKYIDASRAVEAPPAKAVAAQKGNQAKIREWAKANGYEIGDRGRIKADIVEAYYKAQDNVPVTVEQDNEASASVALDGETQVIDTEEPSEADLEQIEKAEPVSEQELDEMLREMALKGVEPQLKDLAS